MNRRELIAAAAGVATLMTTTAALAAEEHNHAAHGGGTAEGGANASLVTAADRCGTAGQACINHCLSLFVAGDTSVAACAKSVHQMTAVCQALVRLAAAGSPHLPAYAKVAMAICLDCEKECRKHEEHHATCKACAVSCAACAEECKKVAA
jgi:Cys-rich four helix bundle protein (predicted Tat secretion target)